MNNHWACQNMTGRETIFGVQGINVATTVGVNEYLLQAIWDRESAFYGDFGQQVAAFFCGCQDQRAFVDDLGHKAGQKRRGPAGIHKGAFERVRDETPGGEFAQGHTFHDLSLTGNDELNARALAFVIMNQRNDVLLSAVEHGVPIVCSSCAAPPGLEELSLDAMAAASFGDCGSICDANGVDTFADMYNEAFANGTIFDTSGGPGGRYGYGYGLTAVSDARQMPTGSL